MTWVVKRLWRGSRIGALKLPPRTIQDPTAIGDIDSRHRPYRRDHRWLSSQRRLPVHEDCERDVSTLPLTPESARGSVRPGRCRRDRSMHGGWFNQSHDEPRISKVGGGPVEPNGHSHQLAIERPKVQLISLSAPPRITTTTRWTRAAASSGRETPGYTLRCVRTRSR